jgi:hypothetical protein
MDLDRTEDMDHADQQVIGFEVEEFPRESIMKSVGRRTWCLV